MNKQEAVERLRSMSGIFEIENREAINTAISALEHQLTAEPTASEFLSKAKAICESKQTCFKCPALDICQGFEYEDDADLIQAVMDYQIKEVSEC